MIIHSADITHTEVDLARFPQDNKFEDFCYRSAILGQRMHAYVETRALGCWIDQTLIPLESDREDMGYCQFIFEVTREADAERMASVSAENAKKIIKASMDSIATEISTKAVTAAQCDMLKQAFGSNGIPHNITRSIIPIFEATASNILGQMSRGRMSVELVTEKVLKSNSKKEITPLDVVINDADTGRLPYLSRSGGERVKAALSVILALSEVMKNKLGVQLGFLFLDEPPFLDADGVRAYVEALEAIQRRYAGMRIMAITHDEAMKSMFPQSVMVIKDENGSHAALE